MKNLIKRERRANPRIRTVHLTAKVCRSGPFSKLLKQRDAAVVDFSRQGVALCCETRFRTGDKIDIQLFSIAEQVKGIKGTVRYVHRNRGEYSIGIQFNACGKGKLVSTPSASILNCMEQVVEQQLA